MPYTDSSGVQIPVGTDAFNPIPQFKTWQDKNATYNNRVVVALDSDRTALAAPVLRNGLECYVTGTGIAWRRVAGAWVTVDQALILGASLAVPNASETAITTWTVTAGPAAWYAAGKVTPNIAGWYAVTIAGRWDASATGIRMFRITRNGAIIPGGVCEKYMPTAVDTNGQDARTTHVYLNGATDYVSVAVYATAGGPIGAYPQLVVKAIA